MVIGVSELQKNISLFKNLTETVHIIDKKTKEVLAMVLPRKEMQSYSLTDSLGGILHRHRQETIQDIDSTIHDAFDEEMRAKYGK